MGEPKASVAGVAPLNAVAVGVAGLNVQSIQLRIHYAQLSTKTYA